jgi:hypothetical protein
MKVVQLNPITEWHTDSNLTGPPGVAVLPITRTLVQNAPAVASVWRVSVWDRIKFLFDGRVNLMVQGRTHPPLSVSIGEAFERVPEGTGT